MLYIASVSYPRSGATFMEYVLANGNMSIKYSKLHHVMYTDLVNYSRLILILRDYKECIIRQNISQLYSLNITGQIIPYMNNIKTFEKFDKPKTCIYYEDLITNPRDQFLKIKKDLNLDMSYVLNNLGGLIEDSKRRYKDPRMSGSDKIHCHKKWLSAKEQESWDIEFMNYDPELYSKYLARYIDLSNWSLVNKIKNYLGWRLYV